MTQKNYDWWHLLDKNSCVFPQDYLDIVGLSAMFPRVEVFLIQGSPVDMLERPPMDGNIKTVAIQIKGPLLGLQLHCSIKWKSQ